MVGISSTEANALLKKNPFKWMVRQAGFEPATDGLEVHCSIQLSYWRFNLVSI